MTPTPLLDAPAIPAAEAADARPSDAEGSPVASVSRGAALAAGLATAGAGAVLGAVFASPLAALFGAGAALGGSALLAWSLGGRRGGVTQWASGPVALLLGAIAALASPGGRAASLPTLVGEALFSGGLAQPPVPFDPGWRFLLVVLLFLLGFGAASVAVAWRRANLGVAVAVPVVVLGALGQPPDAGSVPIVLGLVGLVGGLVVASAVGVASQDVDAGIPVRRVFRGLASLAVLAVVLGSLAQVADGLLPEPAQQEVIPPQRPPVAEPGPDVELFTVQSNRLLPWRLGVLDVYDDDAWKTPPFDVARFQDVGTEGGVSGEAPAADSRDVEVTFVSGQLVGRTLPGLASPRAVHAAEGQTITVDPRTQALRSEQLLEPGTRWTVRAPAPSTGENLAAARPHSSTMSQFLEVPPPPPEVAAILAAVTGVPGSFEALQAVRQVWYDTVVAAGVGDPIDVAPDRVAAILRGDGGSEASPWEIVAGEALLARWAGVPARIGYGWFGGDPVDGGWSVRPRHGALWLEVHFEGQGWVPLVGKPPRAKGSLSDGPKNDDPAVRPTDELALITYVPIRQQNITLLFEVVRFWLARVAPIVIGVVAGLALMPVPRRAWRRRRWSRWARRNGPGAEVLVHYAALRDRAWDLNIGQPAQTPLEFADAVRPDDEHRELAWLVTRVLWGDLAADAGPEHVEAVRVMAASVTRRLVAAQPGTARLVAAASRASVGNPWAAEAHAATRPVARRLSRRPRAALAALVLVLLSASCTQTVDLRLGASADVLPATLVPMQIDDVRFEPEPAAEVAFEEAGDDAIVDFGRVWSIRVEDTIEASLQVVALRPGVVDRAEDVREGLLASLGGGQFEPIRVGEDSVLAVETAEQRLLLWFAPGGDWYQLLVARRSFDRADEVFAAVLATQRGQRVTGLTNLGRTEKLDARRGMP